MAELIAPVAVVAVLGVPVIVASVWLFIAFLRAPSFPLDESEKVINSSRVYLTSGQDRLGKHGHIALTNRRLLWVPIPFPIPPTHAQSFAIAEIKECKIGKRTWPFGPIPLLVHSNGRWWKLHFGGWPGTDEQELWGKRIAAAASLNK